MDTIAERLTYLIESQYDNKHQFCIDHDINYSAFNPITTGSRTLGINNLDRLVEIFPNLNVNWLLYGKGTPYIDKYVYENENIVLNEPKVEYEKDGFEELLLKYLSKKKIIRRIKDIANEKIE